MSLPPPKHRDLSSLKETTTETAELNVWEIGVPPKTSLYWSIALSYLLSVDDERFAKFIQDLKSSDSTGTKKKNKSISSEIDFHRVKKKLQNFNPFKNRHVYFKNSEIMEAFKLKLNQYGTKTRSKTDTWNDDLKLKAASAMLDCSIHVYFPDEKGTKFVSYPRHPEPKLPIITLFQYLNQSHKSRTESMSIFRFAMTVKHSYPLKLHALSYFLKKAKISTEDIGHVQLVMNDIEERGDNFLSKILQSPYFNILPSIYKSPYIALKVSQAGFETNPSATQKQQKPSPFLFAAAKTDTKYIRILYDYAANCRYLFEMTVRDPDDIILESLKILRDIFTTDKFIMDSCCNFDTTIKERTMHILNQFSRLNEYQQNIADLTVGLKKDESNDMLNNRKELIQGILGSYTKYFYFDFQESDVLENFLNYLKFNEYYENIDTFSCLYFFDSVYPLKKVFQLKDEDIFAGTESNFFLLTVSSRYFPLSMRSNHSRSDYCETDTEIDESLQLIPLLYREKLKEEISKFQNELNEYDESDLVPKNKIKEETLTKCLSAFPQIRDELLVSRIGTYLKAAINLSFDDENGIKGILVVERALQILGESLKPQSTQGCVVSCLLRSRLPIKLIKKLIEIRNDISHYCSNSVQERLAIENDSEYFKNLQLELKEILKQFEAVAFTQYLRLENFLIEEGQRKISQVKLNQEIVVKFQYACEKRLKNRVNSSTKYHEECIKLSLDTIMYLIEFIRANLINSKNVPKKKLDRYIKIVVDVLGSIEYVFNFLCREVNENVFQAYLKEVESYFQDYRGNKKIASLLLNMNDFQKRYTEAMNQNFKIEFIPNLNSKFPTLFSFFKSLEQNEISTKDLKEIIKAAKDSYNDAKKAKDELKTYIINECISMSDKEVNLIDQLLISKKSSVNIKQNLKNMKWKHALKELDKKWMDDKCLEEKIKEIFENKSEDPIVKTLLIKIIFQKNLKTNVYTSANLSDDLTDKLKQFFMKKLNFLLCRIENMRSVLIEEDEEIESTYIWGRSIEIQHHLKFLMRQRFLREMPVRAALEMALFDCLNILKNDKFFEIYEKVNNLFTGINLRNVMAHGNCVLETIGGLLDEDDLPSELIDKIVELIKDSEAIITMRDFMPRANTLEMDTFIAKIENNKDPNLDNKIKKITSCKRWQSYLSLFPLI